MLSLTVVDQLVKIVRIVNKPLVDSPRHVGQLIIKPIDVFPYSNGKVVGSETNTLAK